MSLMKIGLKSDLQLKKKMFQKNLRWSMSMTPNQLLPIFFNISRKVNLIFDHLKLIFPENVIDENRFEI